jgi:hypothetical protein
VERCQKAGCGAESQIADRFVPIPPSIAIAKEGGVRHSIAIALSFCAITVFAGEPISSRTGSKLPLAVHSHERAGTATVARFAAPSIQKHDGFGLVNGTTFGSDYFGLGRRPGRIFPGLWPSRSQPVADRYRAEPKFAIPDPVGSKPFRKAVAEAAAPEGHR